MWTTKGEGGSKLSMSVKGVKKMIYVNIPAGGIWKVHMVRKESQPKVPIRSTRGRGVKKSKQWSTWFVYSTLFEKSSHIHTRTPLHTPVHLRISVYTRTHLHTPAYTQARTIPWNELGTPQKLKFGIRKIWNFSIIIRVNNQKTIIEKPKNLFLKR